MADDSNSSITDCEWECNSSSFESNDAISSAEEDIIDPQLCIRPYMFEPKAPNNENDSDNENEASEFIERRVGNKEWCQCGHCDEMPTEVESKCCQEIHKVALRIQEYESEFDTDLKCVTQHPGFEPLCLNRTVLEAAYLTYRQHYDVANDKNIMEQRRYTAYRQLARWCWGYLGKDVRVTLPSCAVLSIRRHFPSDLYVGFDDKIK